MARIMMICQFQKYGKILVSEIQKKQKNENLVREGKKKKKQSIGGTLDAPSWRRR